MTSFQFKLTPDAKEDIGDIARYTVQKWGKPQAMKYAGLLDACFQKIAQNEAVSKAIFPDKKYIRVCRCEHHYIFYVRREGVAIILAVLHERMDLMERLKQRLPS